MPRPALASQGAAMRHSGRLVTCACGGGSRRGSARVRPSPVTTRKWTASPPPPFATFMTRCCTRQSILLARIYSSSRHLPIASSSTGPIGLLFWAGKGGKLFPSFSSSKVQQQDTQKSLAELLRQHGDQHGEFSWASCLGPAMKAVNSMMSWKILGVNRPRAR